MAKFIKVTRYERDGFTRNLELMVNVEHISHFEDHWVHINGERVCVRHSAAQIQQMIGGSDGQG